MSQKEDKGVSQNPLSKGGKVRRDDAGSDLKRLLKVEATLKSNEVARYTKIAQIFKKVLLPKEEAKRLESAKKKVGGLPISTPKSVAMKNGNDNWFKKILGPAALVLGGLGALVAGLMSDGQAKGFLKILAKAGISGGVKLLSGTFAKMGKFVGGIIKNLGGILLKPFKFLKGGKIMSIFGKMASRLFKFLKPVLKRIPGIGSLISWSFAVSRFKKGDVVGGLIDVASGIATLFPGVGTALGIGLDVLNAFLDMKKGGEDGVKPAGSGFSIGDFFGKVKDKIMNNFPIKNLVEFWGGAQKVMSGNFKEGFTKMAYAIPFMKPLSDWLFSEREEVQPDGAVVKKKSIAQAMRESILKKAAGWWKSTPAWMKSIARKVLPDSIVKALDDGSEDILDKEYADNGTTSKRDVRNKNISKKVSSTPVVVTKVSKQRPQRRKNVDVSSTPAIQITKKNNFPRRGVNKNKPMQDFIVENGTVMPFSDKDSVLGMKKGGAIDNLINQGSVEIKKLNQQLITLAAEQTQLLREIAFNTKASKAPQGNTVIQGGSNQQSPPQPLNIREGFTSAYA